MIEFRPVIVKNDVQLYDIFIDNEWHGSRRTKEQCEMYIGSKK